MEHGWAGRLAVAPVPVSAGRGIIRPWSSDVKYTTYMLCSMLKPNLPTALDQGGTDREDSGGRDGGRPEAPGLHAERQNRKAESQEGRARRLPRDRLRPVNRGHAPEPPGLEEKGRKGSCGQ